MASSNFSLKTLSLLLLPVLLLIALYAIRDILFPFIMAIVLAYLLDPAADKLERWGISRTYTTLLIIGVFFVLCGLIGMLITPLLYEQLMAFINKIPEYTTHIKDDVIPRATQFLTHIDPRIVQKTQDALTNFSSVLLGGMGKVLQNIWHSGMVVLNVLSLLFITPIVTFYVLRDWDHIMVKLGGWLPKRYAPTIHILCRQIHLAMAGYVRGQINVCLLLAAFYSIGLSLVKLEFGLFIGLLTGLLTCIPYIGFAIGCIAGMTVAFFQFDDLTSIALTGVVYAIGQVLESYFLTPKLVGSQIGLHPVWMIFAMLAGASLAGFSGILLAIPLAGVAGVLVRFGLSHYLQSRFYQDSSAS